MERRLKSIHNKTKSSKKYSWINLSQGRKYSALIVILVLVVSLGSRFLLTVEAATMASSQEAETGTLSGNAAQTVDTNASGGTAIKFGASNASGSSFYGVNWHPIWINDGGQNAEMDLMKQAGIKSVRIDAEWYSMESSKGTYPSTYMERMDNAVNGLVSRGIDPEVIVTSTPAWVTNPPSDDPDPAHEPPVRGTVNSGCDPSKTICSTYNHVSDYDNFLSYLMNRWNDKVHDWEIWNEPDGNWAWRTTGSATYPQDYIDRGVDYTTLLKSAYQTAKSIDPNSVVIGGVLSNATQSQQYMLKSMYSSGVKGYFDVWAQHLYCDPPGHNWCNTDRTIYDPQTLANTFTTNIAPTLQQNGDGSKPVWIDETGYNSYAAGGGVSEATQASYLTQSFNDDKTLPNVARVFWYDMDGLDTGTDSENYYGIISADMYNANSLPSNYRLKPAHTALKNLATGQ